MAYTDTASIRTRLRKYYTPEEIDRWMTEKHPQLGQSANDAIEAGRKGDVDAIIDRLDADGYL